MTVEFSFLVGLLVSYSVVDFHVSMIVVDDDDEDDDDRHQCSYSYLS